MPVVKGESSNPVQETNSAENKESKSVFFPSRGAFKGEHKKNGVYVTEEGEIIFNKSEGPRRNSLKFKLDRISSINHFARFKFLFLVVVYRWESVNSIIFTNKKGELLASLFVKNMKPEVLSALLQEIKKQNSEIKFGEYVSEFIKTGDLKVFQKQYNKAVWKGLRWWIVAFVVFMFFVLVFSVI